MGPGSSGGSEGGAEFVVEEPDTGVYNPSGVDPPVWQPAPHDILLMLDQLHKDQVLPLKWVCPGRRPPEADAPEQPLNDMSDGDEGEDGKEEEKRTPEPSAFDFDDTASEASAKVKITPRTPAQAKRPEKKVACMDNIISSLKRQQKAEREARKSQARSSLGGMTALRPGGGGGTPARVSGFSPSSSPHVSAAPSPSSGSPRGSPRVPAVVHSPSPRVVADSGETVTDKKPSPSPPTTTMTTASVGTASPSVAQGHGNDATSPPVKVPEASGTEEPPAPPPPQSASSSCAGDSAPSVKAETEQAEASADPVVPMETDAEPSDSTAVKQEG